jgi:4'-phosphopantetheinyl transferase
MSTATRGDGQLPPHAVHVWIARLDEIAREGKSLQEDLSEKEAQRAERFNREKDRVRYVTSLAVLRSILGSYLHADPKQIEFRREKNNKPTLSGTFSSQGIQFSMSRSDGLALYAFARDLVLGVDIERIAPIPEMDRIVSRFFAPREIEDYFRVPPTARTEAFFPIWTRKEAFLKATGNGLSLPLDSFSVSLQADGESVVKDASGNQTITPHVLLRDLHVERGFAAAVAVEGCDRLFSLPAPGIRFDRTLFRMSFGRVPETAKTSQAAAEQ